MKELNCLLYLHFFGCFLYYFVFYDEYDEYDGEYYDDEYYLW